MSQQEQPITTPHSQKNSTLAPTEKISYQLQKEDKQVLAQYQYSNYRSRSYQHNAQSCYINTIQEDSNLRQMIETYELELDQSKFLQQANDLKQSEQFVKEHIDKIISKLKQIFKKFKNPSQSVEDGLCEYDVSKKQLKIQQKIGQQTENLNQNYYQTSDSDKLITILIIFPKNDLTTLQEQQKGRHFFDGFEEVDNFIQIKCSIENLQLKECHHDEMIIFLEQYNSQQKRYSFFFDKKTNTIYSQFQIYIFEPTMIHHILQAIDMCTLLQYVLIDEINPLMELQNKDTYSQSSSFPFKKILKQIGREESAKLITNERKENKKNYQFHEQIQITLILNNQLLYQYIKNVSIYSFQFTHVIILYLFYIFKLFLFFCFLFNVVFVQLFILYFFLFNYYLNLPIQFLSFFLFIV